MIAEIVDCSSFERNIKSAIEPADQDFYSAYGWCLNAYPSIREVMRHLEEELSRYLASGDGWRRDESARNVFLLSCVLLDTADDYLLGRRYNFSKVLGVLPALAPVAKLAQRILHAADSRSWLSRRRVSKWRVRWESVVTAVTRRMLLQESPSTGATTPIAEMRRLLSSSLPSAMYGRHPRIPAAFRSQDLTHFDVLSLADKFIAAFPDRSRVVLVTGLRTAGSYFAILLRAYLESKGYARVECVTLRPKAGVSRWEAQRISENAAHDCLAAIIDEPIGTGGTLGKGIAMLTKLGIQRDNIAVLFPVHKSGSEWRNNPDAQPICAGHLITLEYDEWFKHSLLRSAKPGKFLREAFKANGWDAEVQDAGSEEANAYLQAVSEEKYHTRLKHVFAVRLTRPGETVTRYILAKSVGWGWLGYHAFLAGTRLEGRVPSVLGLRDGILYSEWTTRRSAEELTPSEMIPVIADYIAVRARTLQLNDGSKVDVARDRQCGRGIEELAGRLSGAYGKAAGILMRARVKRDVAAMQTHEPVLVDSRMRRLEWIPSAGTMLKSDFEHHGMGKHQLNMTDPAYDLAEAILYWNLSPTQESDLLDRYASQSGDRDVHGRILLHKILAGSWSMDRALENLNDARMLPRHEEFNRQYLEAWNFLVLHTTRFCGERCDKPQRVRWASPLAVLDIDGVIDKQVFGFPSTTAAGIQALSLLHRNEFAIALNTARSIGEVKEYCRAYGCVGGVAEYGAHVWDAVSDQERVLISNASLETLDRVRGALRRIPGVFLNDDYKYSIRAYTYERGRSVPLPAIVVQDLIAGVSADGLAVHHTYTDTTILSNETDKGRGMRALLDLAGMQDAETFAIGDSAPDLSMFRSAAHSFAPGNISCRAAAQLLNCRVAGAGYQRGLLECAGAIVRNNGKREQPMPLPQNNCSPQEQYFLSLLKVADRSSPASLIRAIMDPTAIQTFVAE